MIIKDHHYWLPVLALYSGARLEEMGQSLCSDIKHERGIYYLDINGDGPGKSLKTASSWRKAPIHPVLVKLGFLAYVDALRTDGEPQLFPGLKLDRRGKRTANYSRAFGQYKRAIGIDDPRKVFHSFRHTFKQACRGGAANEEVHDALTGHSSGSVGRSYGAVPLKTLADAIGKVRYELPGFDGP